MGMRGVFFLLFTLRVFTVCIATAKSNAYFTMEPKKVSMKAVIDFY